MADTNGRPISGCSVAAGTGDYKPGTSLYEAVFGSCGAAPSRAQRWGTPRGGGLAGALQRVSTSRPLACALGLRRARRAARLARGQPPTSPCPPGPASRAPRQPTPLPLAAKPPQPAHDRVRRELPLRPGLPARQVHP